MVSTCVAMCVLNFEDGIDGIISELGGRTVQIYFIKKRQVGIEHIHEHESEGLQ